MGLKNGCGDNKGAKNPTDGKICFFQCVIMIVDEQYMPPNVSSYMFL